MSLYQIIKSLQDAQGNINKQAILDANKDDALLKAYMKAVYDPAINYWQSKVPPAEPNSRSGPRARASVNLEFIQHLLYNIAGRVITGGDAKNCLETYNACFNAEDQELLSLMIKRSIGASVGDTMVLKTWPDLYFIPPYQRCSLMDDKIKLKFSSLPLIYVQPKLDGSFAYLVKEAGKAPEVITRAGSKYPTWFAERLTTGLPDGIVLVGEIEVYAIDVAMVCTSKLLTRQEGNGLLNSALQDGDEDKFTEYSFVITCWDMLTPEEFKVGKSTRIYSERLKELEELDSCDGEMNVQIIMTDECPNLDQAYKVYSHFTKLGLEGAVAKNPVSLWKDGTSKDNIKLKITFEAEYVITGYYEGTGKAKGMLGGISIATSDGKIKSNCGSGFSDAQRKAMWTRGDLLLGDIVTIIANDVVTNRSDSIRSLFLPIYSETRLDKKEADSYSRVMEQLNAAKGL